MKLSIREPVIRRRQSEPYILVTAALFGLCLLSACGKKEAAQPPPPAEVSVVVIEPETVPVITELPGRIEAIRTSEVRARATGILLRQLFKDGAEVKEGDVLFEIDPAPLQATLANANANHTRTEATRGQAAADLVRYDKLMKDGAISKQEFDQRVASNASRLD